MLAAIVALRFFEYFGVVVGSLRASEDPPPLLGEDSTEDVDNVADDSVVLIGEGTDVDPEAILSDIAL